MKRLALVLAGVAVLIVGAAIAFVFVRRQSVPSPEVLVTLDRDDRAATALTTEASITTVLEDAIGKVDGLASMRSETTASGVRIVCAFDRAHAGDELALADRVRHQIGTKQSALPPETDLPEVTLRAPTETLFVWSQEPLRDRLARIPGTTGVTTCNEPGRERVAIRIDPTRLHAYGLGLADVWQAFVGTAPLRMVNAQTSDPEAIGSTTLRPARPDAGAILLRDVATIAREHARPSCTAQNVDRTPGVLHRVAVRTEHLTAARAAAHALDPNAKILAASEAAVLHLRFPNATREAQAEALARLLKKLPDRKDASPHSAALDADGEASIVVASPKLTRERLAEMRDAIRSEPGVGWGGATGAARGLTSRIEVVIAENELDVLARRATEVKTSVEAVPGVLALVSGEREREQVPRHRIAVDAAAAKRANVIGPALHWATDLGLHGGPLPLVGGVEASLEVGAGPAVLTDERVSTPNGPLPLTSFVQVTNVLEPQAITHADRSRAIVLVWETTDERGVLERITKAVAAIPNAKAAIARPPYER